MVHEPAEDPEIRHLEELQVEAAQTSHLRAHHSLHRPVLLLGSWCHRQQNIWRKVTADLWMHLRVQFCMDK